MTGETVEIPAAALSSVETLDELHIIKIWIGNRLPLAEETIERGLTLINSQPYTRAQARCLHQIVTDNWLWRPLQRRLLQSPESSSP